MGIRPILRTLTPGLSGFILATFVLGSAPWGSTAHALGRLSHGKAPANAAQPAASATGASAAPATPAPPWKASEILSTRLLADRLGARNAPKILHVGPPALYEAGHVPGAAMAGPGSDAAGLKRLAAAVAGLPKDCEMVLYCGCCPMQDCPNLAPAYRALKSKGFKNVRVLDMPTDFTIDWAKKGYPVEKGKPGR